LRRKTSISHYEAMIRRIRKDRQFVAEYRRAAPEENDGPSVLLLALRHVAQARGIAKISKAAGIERESLYRALSARGNPRLSTLHAVAKAVGLRLLDSVCRLEATFQSGRPSRTAHRWYTRSSSLRPAVLDDRNPFFRMDGHRLDGDVEYCYGADSLALPQPFVGRP
jgi:probable addiction module antidote protein